MHPQGRGTAPPIIESWIGTESKRGKAGTDSTGDNRSYFCSLASWTVGARKLVYDTIKSESTPL
jgi:hypothetical protein